MEHFQDRSRSPPRAFSRHPPFSKQALSAQYLILYNLVSAILWVSVLGRVVLLTPIVGFNNVYGGVGQFAKWTQTLAVLEIVHSAIGTFPHAPACT
jgi:very-long-chain (3R)-3-hydroxyacyl-CoA dehydratase